MKNTLKQIAEGKDSIEVVRNLAREALAQPEETCPGCEAAIKAACGRESCPKGWEESASVAYIRGFDDGMRQERAPLTDEQIINEADRFDWDKDCALRFARAIEAAHGIKE